MNVNKEPRIQGGRLARWLRQPVAWGVVLVLALALVLMLHGSAEAQAVATAARTLRAA